MQTTAPVPIVVFRCSAPDVSGSGSRSMRARTEKCLAAFCGAMLFFISMGYSVVRKAAAGAEKRKKLRFNIVVLKY